MTIISPTNSIRYWRLTGTDRVIAVPCQMVSRWEEIGQDEFLKLVVLRNPIVEESNG